MAVFVAKLDGFSDEPEEIFDGIAVKVALVGGLGS